jgi:hypothetical protein
MGYDSSALGGSNYSSELHEAIIIKNFYEPRKIEASERISPAAARSDDFR